MPDFKTFTVEDQERFAALTGDFNPIHMDPVAARRTQAGAPVVHGIHTLLWLLDWVGARQPETRHATTLSARFPKMLYLGDRVEARISQTGPTSLRAQGSVDGVEVVNVVVGFGHPNLPAANSTEFAAQLMPRQAAPSALQLHELTNLSGRVAFVSGPAEMEQAFPGAARLLGRRPVAALGCSTYLVGMVVPGLHSLYGALDLAVDARGTSPDELRFAVTEVDPRFRRVVVRIDGGGLSGTLQTFGRVPPVAQPSMAEVAKHVSRGEFNGSMALIIGGSRGLGELTAKLIAAGGGKTIISYASGRADADRLAAEIVDWGGLCNVVSYDVRADAAQQLESLAFAPTHLYYFATPQISRRKPTLFSRERFEEFNDFYVHGFLRLIEAIMPRAPGGIAAFYPSSVYVLDRPADMTEYAMSKAAGEILCADIARSFNNVKVLTTRLPRLQTDQTASLFVTANVESLSVMLPIVRKMHEQTL